MSKVSVLSGPERRRRWSTIEKLRIVEESQAASASVVDVARRNDLHPNLLAVNPNVHSLIGIGMTWILSLPGELLGHLYSFHDRP